MKISDEVKIESLLSMAVNSILYDDSYLKTFTSRESIELKEDLEERGENFLKILIDILENDYPELPYHYFSNKIIFNLEPEVEVSIFEEKYGALICLLSITIVKDSALPKEELEFIVNKLNQNSEYTYRLGENLRDIYIKREINVKVDESLIASANYVIQILSLMHSSLVYEIRDREDKRNTIDVQPSELIVSSRNWQFEESISMNEVFDEINYLKNILIPKKFRHFIQFKKINSNIIEIYLPLRKNNIVCKQSIGVVLNPSNYGSSGILLITEIRNEFNDIKKSREFVGSLNKSNESDVNYKRGKIGSWITTEDKDLAIIYKNFIPYLEIRNSSLGEIISKSISEIIYGNEEIEIEKKFIDTKESVKIL